MFLESPIGVPRKCRWIIGNRAHELISQVTSTPEFDARGFRRQFLCRSREVRGGNDHPSTTVVEDHTSKQLLNGAVADACSVPFRLDGNADGAMAQKQIGSLVS